ncbi:predicted protein [Thalassiosira pseudonana CCMP1335]|uniref:peptidylprolyl isomerase n=1 Tax=Thalassiosira pseudonana TaxID=35128 RepID=B8C0A9_THAPS|nr:predicted protein [Thalassiosira pseudonana CCMP1335]EED93487.1 predicted protein [Thalassiosira pseudonana CCMP1335]
MTNTKLITLLSIAATTGAFSFTPSPHVQRCNSKLHMHHDDERELVSTQSPQPHPLMSSTTNRRTLIQNTLLLGGLCATNFLINPNPASALVEGSKPPSSSKSLGEEYRQGTAALADSQEAEAIPREAYNKLESGVIYADINAGSGETVKEGSRVNLQWVLRRSNGYFVDSSAVSDSVPFIFTVGDPKGAIAGLDQAVRGMKVGGTRRILIPPKLAYVGGVDDGKPGPIPAGFGPRQQMRRVMEVRKDVPGEYIFLEVKLTKVR